MSNALGYDCDGNEIYEFMILHAIWSNDVNVEELENVDARCYCTIIGDDGISYVISVYDWVKSSLIRAREGIKENEEIPTIVKPISEMENYEIAKCDGKELHYDLNRNELKEKLNMILSNKNVKKLVRN